MCHNIAFRVKVDNETVKLVAKDKQLLSRVLTRVWVHWRILVLAIVFTAIASATQPALAYIMKPLLDQGFDGRNPEYIWQIPLVIVSLFLLRGLFSYVSAYLIALVANRVLVSLRLDMFRHLIKLPDAHFQKGESARLFNHFMGEVGVITSVGINFFTVIIREIFVVIAVFGLLIYLSWQLTLIIILLMPLTMLASRFFSHRLREIGRLQIQVNASHTDRVRETIDGQRVIKLFHAQEYEVARFSEVNDRLKKVGMKSAKSGAAITPVTQFTIAIAVGVVISVALYQSYSGLLSVGSFVAFATALVQVFDPIKRLTSLSAQIQSMMAAAESVFGFLDTSSEKDTGHLLSFDEPSRSIEFQDVCFTYPNTTTPALDHISLSIQEGQTVAFVGTSGGGKTTLVNTLPRFVEIDSGRITLGGVDIHDLSLDALRRQISLVSQHVMLFRGTIAENVAYGCHDKVSEEQIIQALKGANLYQHIQQLPEGIHTDIGENGSWLSGGQRQRLAIARAMLKNAPILILDEATSALDNESERLVQASLENLMQGRTTLVIAHRLSTIQNADKIVVIDKGRIVEMGTHESLLEKGQVYAHLYQIQFKQT